MAGSRPSSFRPFLIAALFFGVFVLFDVVLIGWLLFRSLSEREVQRLLLETREEAVGLAGKIEGRAHQVGEDLFTAVALERETQTYIDSVLRHRDIVQTVEVRDKNGVLVMRDRAELSLPVGAPPAMRGPESPTGLPRIETQSSERQSTYEVTVPIGELGSLRVGISPVEMAKRIEVLRKDLVRQTSVVGLLTLLLLATAFLLISWLLRRGRRLEEQAAEAERLAYIGTLAAGLAHEIRNPLNSLNLNMQMLEEELHGGAPATSSRRLLALTRSEISRLERLVSDFLAYARPRPLELREVPAIDLLDKAQQVFAGPARRAGAHVVVADETDGALIKVDSAQMQQLLLNLLQNALAATEGTGRPAEVQLRARRDGPRVLLAVADNGHGIAEPDRAKVFEMFYTTRKGGTGLGLAIVQRVARAHGATVQVESAEGRGTTFTVALPVAISGRRATEGRLEGLAPVKDLSLRG